MSETGDHPGRPTRLPYVAALFCAACLTTAAALWMRYSYCWEFTVEETARPMAAQRDARFEELKRRCIGMPLRDQWQELMATLVHGGLRRWPARAYVRLHAVVKSEELSYSGGSPVVRTVEDPLHPEWRLWVKAEADVSPAFREWERRDFVGRIESGVMPVDGPFSHWWACVDTTSGRLTGASVAGLVVGAMGVFVFAVTLRQWLKERGRMPHEAGGARPPN